MGEPDSSILRSAGAAQGGAVFCGDESKRRPPRRPAMSQHPLALFRKIYVINLPSRDDRRREMQAQFQRIGLGLAAPLVELFPAIRPGDRGSFPSVGSRGCFLSHLGALQKAVGEDLDRILILEDDLNFSDDFMQRVPLVAERLRGDDWSMFYGGYRLDRPVAGAQAGCAVLAAEDGVQTSHFVAFRGPVIAGLVAYLEAQLTRPAGDPRGGPMHVDGSYTWFRREHPQHSTLLAVPELGYQRASKTDVHELGLRDTAPVVRTAMAALRKLKNRL
jgi:glycosyl transferase family 25